MLADATTHVHSNSPPAMPCSNPRAPGPTNLRFNGITRPIYKRSRLSLLALLQTCQLLSLSAAATSAPFDQHNIEF